jgi:trans-L-3-hydroxyproline dehydratase
VALSENKNYRTKISNIDKSIKSIRVDQSHMNSLKKRLSSLHSNFEQSEYTTLSTIDAHTGGEPLRIVTAGFPYLPGNTMLEKRRYMKAHHDHFRKAIMLEPRGHADMYGCIITEPVTDNADFGVLFMHNEGYSAMCGHGIIAVTKVALDGGLIPIKGEVTEVKIDTPAGLITAYASTVDNKVERVSFQNVPSFVQAIGQVVDIKEIGKVKYDIAFGGAFYAYVNAQEVGLELTSDYYSELIQKGMAIKKAVMNEFTFKHPFEEDLNFLYGTIFIGTPLNDKSNSRNVCIFANGEMDRSPTGTGVSGRMALHYFKGEINVGESMMIESIVGSTFVGRVKEVIKFGQYDAVIPEIEGTAFITGKHTFIVDPNDPLKEGFILR